jgi:hypothetical protein
MRWRTGSRSSATIGSDAIVGHFAAIAEGAHPAASGKKFLSGCHGGAGNDVMPTELGNAATHTLRHAVGALFRET